MINGDRAQSLYWNELTELRAAYEYTRLYRDHLARIDTLISVARSVAGLAALGAWITTNINPHIWAGVIVFVQTAEAAQKATPFTSHLNGTNELCSAFESLFIGALQEWEQDIASGRMDEVKIKKSWGRLMTAREPLRSMMSQCPLNVLTVSPLEFSLMLLGFGSFPLILVAPILCGSELMSKYVQICQPASRK